MYIHTCALIFDTTAHFSFVMSPRAWKCTRMASTHDHSMLFQSSDPSLVSSGGDLSSGTTPNSVSALSTSYPPSKSGEALLHSHLKRGSSQDIHNSNHSSGMSRTDTEVPCEIRFEKKGNLEQKIVLGLCIA